MSTYYSIGCERCKEELSIVGRWLPDRWGWMYSWEKFPDFIAAHEDHLDQLRVYSEHDERYGSYKDFSP